MKTANGRERCACGSGKSYKRCHAEIEALLSRPEPQQRLHAIDDWLVNDRLQSFADEVAEGWDDEPVGGVHVSEDDLALVIALFHRTDPLGRTIADAFRDARAGNLRGVELAWLDAQRAARLSVWRVEALDSARTITVRDVFAGDVRLLAEPALSRQLRPGELMLGRVAKFDTLDLLVGAHGCSLFAKDLTGIRDGMDAGDLLRAWEDLVLRVSEEPVVAIPSLPADSLPEQEAGTAYASRIGPISGSMYTYCAADAEGRVVALFPEVDARRAIERLRRETRDLRLLCSPDLATIADAGLEDSPLTMQAAHVRCALAGGIALHLHDVAASPRAIEVFLEAAAALWRAAPWRMFDSDTPFRVRATGTKSKARELSLLGNAGEEFGLVLYPKAGSVARMIEAWDPSEAANIDALSATFEPEPDFAIRPLREWLALPELPIPLKLSRGRRRPVHSEDLALLSCAMLAAVRLDGDRKGTATLDGITVTIEP